MAALGVRRLAWLVGGAGLAFGGCGKDRGGDAAPSVSAGVSGSAGASGAAISGSGSLAGRGGSGSSGAAGGQLGVAGAVNVAGGGGAVTSAGSVGDGDGAGAGGAGGEGGDVGSGGTVMVGGAPPVVDCEPGTGFVGQLTGPASSAPNGGIFTTNPDSVHYGDANLDGVIAAYPPSDEVIQIAVDVQGAVVTATAGATPGPGVSASRTDFWIADEHAVLKVELDPELGPSCCPDFEVRSGMRISFKATEVGTFIGLGQIRAASNFVAGSQGNCVLVAEPDKITDVDFFQMVRVSAKLGDKLSGGGDFTSWRLGLSDVILYDFMAANPDLQKGQTVTFVGPVSPYVGYHMLVESNRDWVKVEN